MRKKKIKRKLEKALAYIEFLRLRLENMAKTYEARIAHVKETQARSMTGREHGARMECIRNGHNPRANELLDKLVAEDAQWGDPE